MYNAGKAVKGDLALTDGVRYLQDSLHEVDIKGQV